MYADSCDAIETTSFRFKLFVNFIHILKHKAAFCKQELKNVRGEESLSCIYIVVVPMLAANLP